MSAPHFDAFGNANKHPTPTPRYTAQDRVRVNAGETLAIMLHAARTNRTWLSDFADETLEVSRDMYEILLAFQRIATEDNARAA